MTYKEGVENFSLNTLPKDLFDGILCVDVDLEINEFPNKVELISSEGDFSKFEGKINKQAPFIYLASAQTTGSLVDFQNAPYKTLLPKIRELAPNPIYVGFGIKTKRDVEIVLENGADGAIIGSELLKQYNENGLSAVENYVNSFV